MASKAFKTDNNKVVGITDKTNQTVINLYKNNESRNLTYIPNIKPIEKPIFLTPKAKKAFNYLQLMFIKASILQNLDLKSHI